MDLVLIGLHPELVDAVRKAPGVESDTVRALGQADLATRIDGIIEGATLVVADESVRDKWGELTDTLNKRGRDLPPLCFVASDRRLPHRAITEAFRRGCLAFLPKGPFTDNANEIARIWRRLHARSTGEDMGAEALRVGALIERREVEGSTDQLLGWPVGQTADARRDLEDISSRLTTFAAGEIPPPLSPFRPAQLLDLFHTLRCGGPLGPKEFGALTAADTTSARSKKKPQFNADRFQEAFASAFQSRDPASVPLPILIEGETGTGKSLVANALHARLEDRAGRKLTFHHVNCSSLGTLADIQLFGGIRGAYTSLEATNPGEIFTCFGGTLFLDEFGSLPLSTQAKLLLFLQDGTVKPAGWSDEPLRIPALVIAATNEHLSDRVSEGKFRQDLFYRFRGGMIHLPPLRTTKHTDLRYLVDYCLQDEQVNPRRTSRGTKGDPGEREVQAITAAALLKLEGHDFPGNFRELQHVLARAATNAVRAGSPTVTEADIQFDESTLPRQDSIIALILREVDGREEVLLRWSPSRNAYFFPGGRVEAGLTYEQALHRDLRNKLGLRLRDYRAHPVVGAKPLSLIEYSGSERIRKQYYFHAYRIAMRNTGALDLAESHGALRWIETAALLLGPPDLRRPLAPTIPHLFPLLDLATSRHQEESVP